MEKFWHLNFIKPQDIFKLDYNKIESLKVGDKISKILLFNRKFKKFRYKSLYILWA